MYGKIFLIVSVITGALGQVFFKLGADKIHSQGVRYYIDVAINPWVFIGLVNYGISFIVWMKVLKYYDISFARPITAFGYIITYIAAVCIIGEELTARRIAGTLLVTAGVVLMK